MRRFVRAVPLDFGTVDAVVNDAGDHYIIDVNTTPACNHPIAGVIDHIRRALGTG